MARRRTEGNETWFRLREWTRDQAAAERLAGHIIRSEGYTSIDPSHPLGGRDQLKDIICARGDQRWVGAAFFPRGQLPFGKIRKKFEGDLSGVNENQADGMAFVTNQELRLSERNRLESIAGDKPVDLLHLERITSILDSPRHYGIRLDFLDIEMTKEDQVSFFAAVTDQEDRIAQSLSRVAEALEQPGVFDKIPTKQLDEFRGVLYSLIGPPGHLILGAPIDRLRPPVSELKEYKGLLYNLTGPWLWDGTTTVALGGAPVDRLYPPLERLREYADLLYRLVGDPALLTTGTGPVDRLYPPLDELREYERTLDSVLEKLHQKKMLEGDA